MDLKWVNLWNSTCQPWIPCVVPALLTMKLPCFIPRYAKHIPRQAVKTFSFIFVSPGLCLGT